MLTHPALAPDLTEPTGEPVFQVDKLNDFDRHPVLKKRMLPPVSGEIVRKPEPAGAAMPTVDDVAMGFE
jgi:hypothetical protein